MLLDKAVKALTVTICVVLLVNVGLFINAHRPPAGISSKATIEVPFFFLDSRKYWSEITDVIACGKYLYLMYDSKNVLACYDIEGNYLHSYLFNMVNNGQTHLYTVNDVLYVETRGHNFYSFKEGLFVNYYPQNSSQTNELRAILSESHGDHQHRFKHYELRKASVWHISESEQKEVLHRPGWLVILQGPTQFIIYILCLVSLALLYLFRWKR